ncbi:MAG: TetR/AcrR family transcriptional regulator [Bacilli bacterium]
MRTRKDPLERKKEILDTAMNLFYENGFESTSMTDIADSMGITKGLIYNYFPSKDILYEEAMTNFINEITNDYINVFNVNSDSLLDAIEKTSNVLNNKKNSPFYQFYRKSGNELVYQQVMIRLLSKLIDPLTEKVTPLIKEAGYQISDPKTFIEFIMFGQIEIFKDPESAGKKKEHVRNYIISLIEASKIKPI